MALTEQQSELIKTTIEKNKGIAEQQKKQKIQTILSKYQGAIKQENGFQAKRDALIKEINTMDSQLRRTLNSNGVFRLEDMKFNDSFYRFPRIDPYNYVDGAKEYLFFTKPDLPLVQECTATNFDAFLTEPAKLVNYFTDLAESPGYRKSVFCNLSYSATKKYDGCPFIRILSNRKTSNMDIPDLQADELETAVNMFGTKILYPKGSNADEEGIDFNIEFEDTRFLEVYHLFKVWDYYRNLKWYGILSPASFLQGYRVEHNLSEHILDPFFSSSHKYTYGDVEEAYVSYLYYKVLNDHIRVFKFLVDNDGETILYAASAIGCYPKTIQRSAFSEIADRGPLKISVGFKVSGWFEDNMTSTIDDFNTIVYSWRDENHCINNALPIYDYEIHRVSQELVDVPFIIKVPPVDAGTGNPGRNTEFCRYMLKWAKSDIAATNQYYDFEKAGEKPSEPSVDTDTGSSETDDTEYTNIQAPNGQMITKNDWDYLKNNNYSDDAARALLFQDDKYKAKENTTNTTANPTQQKTWNGQTPFSGTVLTGYDPTNIIMH